MINLEARSLRLGLPVLLRSTSLALLLPLLAVAATPDAQAQSYSLTASNVEARTATLTLGGYSTVFGWHYKYTVPSGGTCSGKHTTASVNLTGLDSNTDYTFKAYIPVDPCSTEFVSSSFLTKPGQPSKPVLLGAGSGKLTLVSSVTGNGTLTRWQYKRKVGSGNFDANWQEFSETENSTSLRHTFSDVTDGTSYQYKVRAVNATGEGAESDATNAAQPGAPAPTLSASSVEGTTATLTLANFAENWWLKHTMPAGGTCTSKGTTLIENLMNISGNTNYTYKAYGDSGCATELVSASFLTKPGKPSKPVLARAGGRRLTVTSSVSGDGKLVRWQYKRKVGVGSFDAKWTNLSETSTSLSHTFTGLTGGVSYQYKVRAVNATGDGTESDAADAVSPTSEELAVSNITTSSATLTLSNYSGSWSLKRTTPSGNCKNMGVAPTDNQESLNTLSSNTNYTYTAYSGVLCGSFLTSASFVTKPGQPSKPVAGKAGSQKLLVTSSVSGGGTISKWQIAQKSSTDSDFGSWSDLTSQTSTTLSHTVSGLNNGTTYQFKVRAVNAGGTSANSAASVAVAPAVATLTASNVEDDTATLTIGDYAAANGWYHKHTVPDGGTCSAKQTSAAASLASLPGNTNHTYKAYSDSGCSTEVASRSFLTKPGQPSKPSAAQAGSQKLLVTSSVSGSGTISHWEIAQKSSTDSDYGSWRNLTAQTKTSLSHTVSGLDNTKTYQFKVRAVNATGDSADSSASVAVSPAVAALTVSNVEDDTATLTLAGWGSAWWLKRTTPADTACKEKGTTLTEDLTGLDVNNHYTYKAYSDNSCTNQVVSASFLTKPGKPSKPVLARAGSGKLRVSTSMSGSGTVTMWEYKRKVGNNNFDMNWTNARLGGYTTLNVIIGADNTKTYQYKFRVTNASGTGPESDASDAVQPGVPTLTASSVEDDTATLTLGKYDLNWWLKRTTPADTACKEKGTDLTEDLTGLDGNTNYTYKAYSDSTCSSEVVSGSFLTKPGQPSKPSAVKAGDKKLLVTSSVTGGGTISHWEIAQKEGNNNYGSWSDLSAQTTTSLSHTVSGLDNTKTYQFKVRAVNATGDSADSSASDAVSPSSSVTDDDVEGQEIELSLDTNTKEVKEIYVKETDALITYFIGLKSQPDTNVCINPQSDNEKILKVTSDSRTFDKNNYRVKQSIAVEIMSPGKGKIIHYWSSGNCTSSISGGASSQSGYLLPAGVDQNQQASPDLLVNVAAVSPPNRPPLFPADAATDQSAIEDEPFTYAVQAATDPDGDDLTYTAFVEQTNGQQVQLQAGDDFWLDFDPARRIFTGTPLEADTPAILKIQVTASDGEDSDTVTFTLTVVEVNDPPRFEQDAEDQMVTEGKPFTYTVPAAIDPDHDEVELVYTAFVEQADGELFHHQEPGWPGWLTFDGNTRTFSGTPGRDDAPRSYTILVKVEDPEGLSDTTSFGLTVETLYNSRLPQVARQWLARFGRTVSSQVVDAIADRMGNDGGGGRITVNGQSVSLPAAEASDESVEEDDDATNGLSGADPFAVGSPDTKEAVDEEPVKASPTARDLLLGSSFLLPLNPGAATALDDGSGDGSGGASGGGWTVWGEASLTNFTGEDGDLSLDGEVITGVAAIDWQRDRWLAGLALSQSEGEGSFTAPATPRDDEIEGTVRSFLTAAHPYIRYRASADRELWVVAGYGRGTMTLDVADEDPANPDIWLATIGIGGRAALLSPAESGGLTVDLTADALFTRTGAAADLPLRDAVEASTTRLRVGVESSWNWQGANGTSVVPTLSTALRYDAGDAETGLGVEIGAGVAYSNPNLGLTLSADVRGLLIRQEQGGSLGLREWGGSGSIQYDQGGDNLGLTASLSPSWGVEGSRADQLWSEVAPPFPAAAGDSGNTDGSGGGGNGAARLDGEIGYGFAAFSGNASVTPYIGLALSGGSRDWRFGSRFSFLPGVDISIEGTRRESETAAPDQSVQLQFNATW